MPTEKYMYIIKVIFFYKMNVNTLNIFGFNFLFLNLIAIFSLSKQLSIFKTTTTIKKLHLRNKCAFLAKRATVAISKLRLFDQ